MNKITWRDIESTDIKGLIIRELPPIIKPRLRVQETEINGVDGSIIEEMGYGSYDKPLVIGLHGNYDIDEIMHYFNGEGNVTFSNEPYKYYKAKIINEINYTRLLRYKEATVTFRVQPYKYELDEGIVTLTESGKTVFNLGYEKSKPKMKITGSGTVEISVNDVAVFTYTFPENETEVVIDSEKQDAYLGTVLKNRNMTGEFPTLKSGSNSITWSGNVTSIVIEPKSRWL